MRNGLKSVGREPRMGVGLGGYGPNGNSDYLYDEANGPQNPHKRVHIDEWAECYEIQNILDVAEALSDFRRHTNMTEMMYGITVDDIDIITNHEDATIEVVLRNPGPRPVSYLQA